MKPSNLIFFLILMLILSGCTANPENTKSTEDVTLVMEEPKSPPPKPIPTPQDATEPEPKADPEPPKKKITNTPDNIVTEENVSNVPEQHPTSEPTAQQECILNETNHILCNLPKEKLSPNPQNLDTKLYSIFRNVIDEVLSRNQGTITTSTNNPDGIGMQEFTFDITNAIDEKGLINPKKEIEASLETLHTLQKSIGYGSSEKQNFREYKSYTRIMGEIISPFLGETFTLENLSSIQSLEENNEVSIIATFTQKATDFIYAKPDNGNVNIILNITKNAELNSIKVEQYSPESSISSIEYTFS